jgi:hypothetical protein
MHRSGTSAVSGTLTKLGCGSPKHLMPACRDNPKGFFESVEVAKFNDELLESAGSQWNDWRSFNPAWSRSPVAAAFRRRAKQLFASEFGVFPLPILKDPRMCRFAPFWLDVLRDMRATPRIVMPIRSPLDVARSLKRRDGISLARGLALWLRHVLDAEAHTRGEARSIFAWKSFLSDWRRACDKIASDVRLSWPRRSDRASHDVERFLTASLVHHNADRAELAAHSDVHEWTLQTYDALLELARNPQSNSAMATLDDIRSRFDQSSEMFGRLLTECEVNLEDARRQAADLGHKQAEMLTVWERARISEAAGVEALRAQLVDAEAALASIRAKRPAKGLRAWLTSSDPRRERLARRLLRSGLFDAEFYRTAYLQTAPKASGRAAKGDSAAAEHYLIVGFCQGCRPNPLFDTRWYLDRYEDVRRSGVNPLLHYLGDGFREGRDPGPEFNTRFYLEANPDVREAGTNPLAHYLRHGRQEGRLAAPPL